ncbi:hypothetical protein BK120_08270 [Paenibacillus sp. FSL A5-0031]|uniref:hypothetical protein n=1 Tax=Paenibacillus sp. FSL A5-0031 TaxID=1920420 RepID=UPI00096E2AD4|nr:hypothetical protein [Paenibacillus sp. FSL A5-0031]OME86908.1 hypothetical protein BK120_08270 [Paenibacillus sp. FSL A5-0031]
MLYDDFREKLIDTLHKKRLKDRKERRETQDIEEIYKTIKLELILHIKNLKKDFEIGNIITNSSEVLFKLEEFTLIIRFEDVLKHHTKVSPSNKDYYADSIQELIVLNLQKKCSDAQR